MKNIVYIKTYNPNQDVKLISIDAKTSSPNVWIPGNNSLENLGKLESARSLFRWVNIFLNINRPTEYRLFYHLFLTAFEF